jgi:molybdenum cofactor cytidylyltransferase
MGKRISHRQHELKLATIVLAADESHHLGEQNHFLSPLMGEPTVRQVVLSLLASGSDPIIVVTGHESRKVELALCDLPVTCVYNDEYKLGRLSSMKCGLQTCREIGMFSGYMIALGDHPFLDHDVIEDLKMSFVKNPQSNLFAPNCEAEPGHPVIISDHLVPEILSHSSKLTRSWPATPVRTMQKPTDQITDRYLRSN